MIKRIYDNKYHFKSAFNQDDGTYYRSNVFENGVETDEEPFMASFPHLLDIGIMGHCEHGLSGLCVKSGVQCYQSGNSKQEANMDYGYYEKIMRQCEGKVFQVALGGRGDADCHEDFERILECTRFYEIVPNITTSGYLFNKEKAKLTGKYCGAAAVSYYKNIYTERALDLLLSEGVTTNMHFVLSKRSIGEAINILEEGLIPKGVSRMIFLLHKPVGLGKIDNVISSEDPRLIRFFNAFKSPENIEKVGFDSCMVPGIIQFAKEIAPECYDPCEGARFSGYIDSNLIFSPCSFDRSNGFAVDIKLQSIEEAWNGEVFENYRKIMKQSCGHCNKRIHCLGGCPLNNEINLCKLKQ